MTPVSTASLMPLSTAGMNSRGTAPPTMPFTNSYPLPGLGSSLSQMWPYWPRLADIRLDLELAPCAVDDDLEVLLAHARDDGLTRLLVGGHRDRRVFVREALKRQTHFLLVRLRLRLNGHGDHRRREYHLLQRDDLFQVAQRVTGDNVLQTHRGSDIARTPFLDLSALPSVHLQTAPDPLLLVLRRHVHGIARVERPGVHAEERQVADEGIVQNLECQGRKRLLITCLARRWLALGIHALYGGHFRRRRHELDDSIEQRLHTLVLERCAAHDQHDLVLDGAVTQPLSDLRLGQLLTFEVLVQQLLVPLW